MNRQKCLFHHPRNIRKTDFCKRFIHAFKLKIHDDFFDIKIAISHCILTLSARRRNFMRPLHL